MADLAWLIRRLKAMSIPEVGWRISQKMIQENEQSQFKSNKIAVTNSLFNKKLSGIHLDAECLMLNWDNDYYGFNNSIPIPGGYDYETYKKKWNAGFQTENEWSEEFSYSLEYKQRDDIGDARTNWELNRHFQFAMLAKNYYASGEQKFFDELKDLFYDWNENNPFLWGISWTSVMEVAIRCSNWCYTWAFLKKVNADTKILDDLEIGIINMTDYIAKHYSRYSSANNHLIVEAYAIGQTGVLCNYEPWIKLAVEILTRELPLQNYSDGVNKELSIHYQSFYMEAMGLMMRLLIKNYIDVPESWQPMLEKMCMYVADCIGDYGEVVVFGDDDEGKILDLQSGPNHYQYVLGLFSMMLDKQYTDMQTIECENLRWLFTKNDTAVAKKKELYKPTLSVCYKEGGNTIMRSEDHKVLIGIDHAALGFGSIAAHGHADALSFQMFYEGKPVFVDPGTYIYHCDIESRNEFRKTKSHNTVCVDGKDQSEMLGAFLWGKKAECRLIDFRETDQTVELVASHDGYDGNSTRKIRFDKACKFEIEDIVPAKSPVAYFHIGPEFDVENISGKVILKGTDISIEFITYGASAISIIENNYSKEYGKTESIKTIAVKIQGGLLKTQIIIIQGAN